MPSRNFGVAISAALGALASSETEAVCALLHVRAITLR
jgi:hypothetical protein